ncbi:unnamed protein product [Arctogadus glacialis]
MTGLQSLPSVTAWVPCVSHLYLWVSLTLSPVPLEPGVSLTLSPVPLEPGVSLTLSPVPLEPGVSLTLSPVPLEPGVSLTLSPVPLEPGVSLTLSPNLGSPSPCHLYLWVSLTLSPVPRCTSLAASGCRGDPASQWGQRGRASADLQRRGSVSLGGTPPSHWTKTCCE